MLKRFLNTRSKMFREDKSVCSFEFNGRTCRGHIVSSTKLRPHFHWFMFDDAHMIAEYGDSIAFKLERGGLVPLYHLTSPELVAAVKGCVEEYLGSAGKLTVDS